MLKTAECVSPLHPDKICDRISDAILDEALRQDPDSRVAVEVMGGHNIITITGEMTTTGFVDVPKVVKTIVGENYGVQTNIVAQSPEIAHGVDSGGAGDQGIMIGYACADNPAMIPQELYLARSLAMYIYEIQPADGKTQITLDEKNNIATVVASWCGLEKNKLEKLISDWATKNNLGIKNILANPAGDWNVGGFASDTGVTGRKLAVDNYGPQIPIGGGAFSGKDATKVDRSGAYMARKIAVDVLCNGEYHEVVVKLAYAIGYKDPVMISVVADGVEIDVGDQYDLTPTGIIKFLDLKKPQFEKTAHWGHFGHGFTWEK